MTGVWGILQVLRKFHSASLAQWSLWSAGCSSPASPSSSAWPYQSWRFPPCPACLPFSLNNPDGRTQAVGGAKGGRPLCTPRPRLPTWRSPRAFPAAGRPRVPHPLHSSRAWSAGRPVGEGRLSSDAPAGDPAPNPPRGAHTPRSTHPGLRSEIRPLVPTRVAAARDKRAAAAPRLIYAAPRPAPRPPQRGRCRQQGRAQRGLPASLRRRPAGLGAALPASAALSPAPPARLTPGAEAAGAASVGAGLSVLFWRCCSPAAWAWGPGGGGVCAARSCGCVGVHARSVAAPARRRQSALCSPASLLFAGPEPPPPFSSLLGG